MIFLRFVLIAVIAIVGFIGYRFYLKLLSTKYRAVIKYDTHNGTRARKDNVLIRTHATGKTYYFLEKLKIAIPKIDTSNVVYMDKGKPTIDFFLDQEKNIHPIKFIKERPVYDNEGNITHREPISLPYQTGEEKSEFAGWLREKNAQYANSDWLTKYGAFALIGVGIIVMAFIIVSAKVA